MSDDNNELILKQQSTIEQLEAENEKLKKLFEVAKEAIEKIKRNNIDCDECKGDCSFCNQAGIEYRIVVEALKQIEELEAKQ